MTSEPIRAAIMADTHGVLRPEVEKILETCDVIVHAGDFDNQLLYHKLSSGWPLYAVRGNNDRGWSGGLPLIKRFEIGGIGFLMAHERKDIPSNFGEAKVIVYGHSHMYQQQEINGRLWLNPGSCGYKRFTLPLSLAVMTIQDGTYQLETIWLEKGYGTPGDAIAQREKEKKSRYERRQKRQQQDNDRARLFFISRMVRQRRAGSTPEWAAENLGTNAALVQAVWEICDQLPDADARKILAEARRRGVL